MPKSNLKIDFEKNIACIIVKLYFVNNLSLKIKLPSNKKIAYIMYTLYRWNPLFAMCNKLGLRICKYEYIIFKNLLISLNSRETSHVSIKKQKVHIVVCGIGFIIYHFSFFNWLYYWITDSIAKDTLY